MIYGTIIYEVRDTLGVSNNEYLVLDAILKLQSGGDEPGWCNASAQYLGVVVAGIDKRNFFAMQKRLIAKDLLQVRDDGKRRVTEWVRQSIFIGAQRDSDKTSLPQRPAGSDETSSQVVMKHHQSSDETSPNNTDNTSYNTQSVARAKKNAADSKKNPVVDKPVGQKAPPVAPRPPAILLFSDSPWAQDPEGFGRALLAAAPEYPALNFAWYYARCRDWSAEKQAGSADWVATARKFATDDARKGKLVTTQPHHNANSNPNSGSATAANNRRIGGLPDPEATLARAARIIERLKRKRGEFAGC